MQIRVPVMATRSAVWLRPEGQNWFAEGRCRGQRSAILGQS